MGEVDEEAEALRISAGDSGNLGPAGTEGGCHRDKSHLREKERERDSKNKRLLRWAQRGHGGMGMVTPSFTVHSVCGDSPSPVGCSGPAI